MVMVKFRRRRAMRRINEVRASVSPCFEALEPRVLLSTFTVTTTVDGVVGSLREAITLANVNPGHDHIVFDIPDSGVQTISPLGELPEITDSLTIDGYSQPGASPNTLANGNDAVLLIVLDGQNVADVDGLTIRSGGSVIRGLVIQGFTDGIQIADGGGNIISGNFIGTDASGQSDVGNLDDGVDVNGVGGNVIGGVTPADRNVISGNDSDGVVLSGTGATNNRVEGNFVGTKADGLDALGNDGNGVRIANVTGNTIGGATAGARNVISGNLSDGVDIRASGNTVSGNYIGVDVTGTQALGNEVFGVGIFANELEPATGNVIGGTTAGHANIIGGNFDSGVSIEGTQAQGNRVIGNFIGTNATGTTTIGNLRDGVKVIGGALNTFVGDVSTGSGNVISGNGSDGVEITAVGTRVLGNVIGLSPDGVTALANVNNGVVLRGEIEAVTGTLIGSGTAGGRNVISGNVSDGVEINGALASGNLVRGNYIGLTMSGAGAVGNQSDGVKIVEAPSNTIGGAEAGQGNVISGNGSDGVQIEGAGATGNSLLNNLIGLAANGLGELGNNSNGVRLRDAVSNQIGMSGAGNTISGNTSDGVQITGGAGHVLQGNRIGTDGTGMVAVGNAANGVTILGSVLQPTTGHRIGGSGAGEGNVISGNGSDGIEITGAQATGILVYGNTIGLNVSGAAVGNVSDGIVILGARNNVIGGVAAGQANTIAGNLNTGVRIIDDPLTLDVPSGNAIRGNVIRDNTFLGIDIGGFGVTPNDAGDGDAGANGLQNFPVLDAAVVDAGQLRVTGVLNGTASGSFTIDFYQSSQTDPSGHGEGEIYLGSAQVVTNGTGQAVIDVLLSVSPAAGSVVTATATSAGSDTSEFSAALAVTQDSFILGDMDGNGKVDAFDVDDFELALSDKAAFIAAHPGLDPDRIGDMDASGVLDAFDVGGFEALLAGGGAAMQVMHVMQAMAPTQDAFASASAKIDESEVKSDTVDSATAVGIARIDSRRGHDRSQNRRSSLAQTSYQTWRHIDSLLEVRSVRDRINALGDENVRLTDILRPVRGGGRA